MTRQSSTARPVTVSRGRVWCVGVVWALALVAVLVRLGWLQVVDADKLAAQARGQHQRTIELPAPRGRIFDRNMRCLAINVQAPSLYAIPNRVGNPSVVAQRLAPILGISRRDLQRRLSSDAPFVWLRRQADREQAARVLALKLQGVGWLMESRRTYPKGTVAGQVLGFAGVDNAGLEGVELEREHALAGQPGLAVVGKDALRRSFVVGEWILSPPTAGSDIVLELDEVLQYQVERELADAVRVEGARSGMAVVLDPFTGEVLAMASSTPFDPNRFAQHRPGEWRNRVVTDVFEPGSSFKVVPLAAALSAGLVSPSSMIDAAGGGVRVGGHVFKDWRTFGPMTLAEVLANSSNVGTIRVAQMAGPERLYETMVALGFGARTGVDLPGEAAGLLAPPPAWSATSIGALAIGQEISVSLLQLAVAYAVIANGGYLVTPRVTQAVLDEAAAVTLAPAAMTLSPRPSAGAGSGRRALAPAVVDDLRQMLRAAVAEGTGKQAALPGYDVAGKTGTAQKIGPNGAYSNTRSVHSFVGFCPAHEPRAVVAVMLDEPRRRWASETAAALFRSLAWHVAVRLQIPPAPASPTQLADTSTAPVAGCSTPNCGG